MKGTQLGELQGITLLSILILGHDAYGLKIQQDISERLKRRLSRGALHSALTRLDEKGFVTSHFGGATKERGGRRKRFYTLTTSGKASLREVKAPGDKKWTLIPSIHLA